MTTSTTINETRQSTSHMPSQRDFEIFRQAEVHGLTHQQLAGIWKVSRRRISQVVERVRNWLSLHPCEDAQIATELQRKRLNQHLERMQLQDVIDRARFALNMAPSYLESVTVRADGKESTTRRQQPPVDVQMLKTLLRAIEAQGRLNARPEIPLPPPPEGEFPWLKAAMNEVWEQWSDKIAWNKKLKPDLFCKFADEFEAAVLKAVSHQKMLDSQLPDEARDTDEREGETPAEPIGSSATAAPVDSSFILPPSSFPAASTPSQREAPPSQTTATDADDATPLTTETCAPSLSAEEASLMEPASPKNPKREAPPPTLSPSLYPSVSPSPCSSPSPCPAEP
jgi:hypothetical protein